MKPLLLLTDSGHGGLIKDSSGKLIYTTGNKKRYKFPDGKEALEGMINRDVESILIKLWEADNRPVVDISHGSLDISLKNRVNFANGLYDQYVDKYRLFYLSLHSNAAKGKGTGVEVFTSKGQTLSDPCATIIIDDLKEAFPDIKFRVDKIDGDEDKEDNFYVLRETKMRAVLVEFLFFDNYSDWQLLQNEEIIEKYAKSLYKSLLKIEAL